MSKTLVLAEKPSVGRDIAKVLHCNKKGNGYLEGDQYIVTWALGHLVTLAEPETYGDQYKTWRLEDLPMLPSPLKLDVIRRTGKQFHSVKAQMGRKDVKDIVIATDAGREGELVARWILEKAHIKKSIKRLWISSVTDKAIKEGFKNLKDGKLYENLYASAVARAEADWIVGINATRALTVKHNAQLSCGRVQTPTVAMIAQREEEIKHFKPKSYYGVQVNTEQITFTWQDQKSKDSKTFVKEKRDVIIKSMQGKKAIVENTEQVSKKSYAPPLYDLTELQRDAHKIFGFSAKETLSIMQKLYEQYKLVTYPRTDSKYLTSDMVDTLKERVEACQVGPYKANAAQLLKQPIKANKAFVDDRKVSDHHAIVPTETRARLEGLSNKELRIYDLIVKRFLAVLHPPYLYEQITITAKIGEERIVTKGRKVASLGWKSVYDYRGDDDQQDNENQSLPDVTKGDQLRVLSVKPTEGETKPLSPFNEGTLLSAMENPTKFMPGDNKTLIKTIGQTGGLGTVATRADIIEKLFNSQLIETRGKSIYITNKGKQLLDLVPDELKSPALTAEWEQKLEAITKGRLSKHAFLAEMKGYAKKTVNEIKNTDQKFKHDNMTGTKCPECGKLMLEIKNKKGKFLVCSDRSCGNRKNKFKITNARCPNCHKRLELHGEGEGQTFVCKCGHREKLTTFNNRRQKEKQGKASKTDVNKYLKKQHKKEDPINTALSDALAKLKFD